MVKMQYVNRQNVLDTIYTNQPISRIDISSITGITPAKVSESSNELILEGVVKELGSYTEEEVRSGRKKILLGVKPNHSYVLGSEISRKFLSFCICDNTGLIIISKTITFNKENALSNVNTEFYILHLKKYLADNKDILVRAIGLAIPGHYSEDSENIISNYKLWATINLKKIKDSFDIPVHIENNVHCISLALRYFDRYNKEKNYAVFHVANGMFCSYVHEGKLFASDKHLVGEIGHLVMKPDGELCECGKKGCLQVYASEAAIVLKSKDLYRNSKTTSLKQLVNDEEDITIKDIVKAYVLGDEEIISVIHQALSFMVMSITNLQMVIDTNLIFVHGELFDQAEIIDTLEKYINANKTVIPTIPNPIINIYHYYDTNGARGACAMAMKKDLIDYMVE